jgi:hypothetical protein
LYQSSVNPDHNALLFEELNEKIIRIAIGKYKKINTR